MTADHKVIGRLYMVTAFCFFLLGGLLALMMRAELARPALQFVRESGYNQLFTIHGTIMMLLFATPMFAGFTNAVTPLQIGAPDVAFPRLNALSYWMYLFGGLMVVSGFLVPGGAAAFGWFAYAPLNSAYRSPGAGGDLWVMGLVVTGLSTTLGAVNFIATILCLRAPGMTMFRMPMFTWNVLFTSILILPAFPVLTAALLVLEADRKFGAQVFDAADGGAILWQHLFWFFGHPEVDDHHHHAVRRGVGAPHVRHRRRAAAVLLPDVVPHRGADGNQVLRLDRHHAQRVPVVRDPMLWSLGFMVSFLLGGLSGVLIASPPLDFHATDSYFIVAHLHYVLFETVVFAMFAGFYFWWPKFTGRLLDERLGKLHFWLLFPAFQPTFLVQHWLGAEGMPRRYADYLPADGFTLLNSVSSFGSFLLGVSTLPFLYNVWHTARYGERVTLDDPWGYGRALEWATSSPPPRHNFVALPRIRSEPPASDLHHPEIGRPLETGGRR
ncbi:cbb3-type cytochrome c oxidase subunit I [Streptomyces sp. NPDC001340]